MNTIGSFDCLCRVGYSGDCTKGNCDGMLYIFYNTKCIYIQYVQVVSYPHSWIFITGNNYNVFQLVMMVQYYSIRMGYSLIL